MRLYIHHEAIIETYYFLLITVKVNQLCLFV